MPEFSSNFFTDNGKIPLGYFVQGYSVRAEETDNRDAAYYSQSFASDAGGLTRNGHFLADNERKQMIATYGLRGSFIVVNSKSGNCCIVQDGGNTDLQHSGKSATYPADKTGVCICPDNEKMLKEEAFDSPNFKVGLAVNRRTLDDYSAHFYPNQLEDDDLHNLQNEYLLHAIVVLKMGVGYSVTMDLLVTDSCDVQNYRTNEYQVMIDGALFCTAPYGGKDVMMLHSKTKEEEVGKDYTFAVAGSYNSQRGEISGYGQGAFLKKKFEPSFTSYGLRGGSEGGCYIRFYCERKDEARIKTIIHKDPPAELFDKGDLSGEYQEVFNTAVEYKDDGSIGNAIAHAAQMIMLHIKNQNLSGRNIYTYNHKVGKTHKKRNAPLEYMYGNVNIKLNYETYGDGLMIDCSSLVSWALLEAGVFKQVQNRGQLNTGSIGTTMDGIADGFKVIEIASLENVRSGDILLAVNNGHHHAAVAASDNYFYNSSRYDAGSQKRLTGQCPATDTTVGKWFNHIYRVVRA